MFRVLFCSTLLACSSLALQAQIEYDGLEFESASRGYSSNYEWEKGDTAYVFGDVVNIRASADASSEIVGKVTIASPVIIAEQGPKTTIQGVEAGWYKVNFKSGTSPKSGFIWGGLLALMHHTIEDVSIVLNIKTVTEQGYPEQVYEVRAARAGVILGQVTQKIPSHATDGTYAALGNVGYSEFVGGIWFLTGGGACGVSSYQWFVFWDTEESLKQLPLLSGVGDGGVFYEFQDYIFPSQFPQGTYRPDNKEKIYVKYEIFETGGDSEGDEYDDFESKQETIIRALKEDVKGNFYMPEAVKAEGG